MGTDSVDRRRVDSGRSQCRVQFAEGTDHLSTDCPELARVVKPISVRMKSLSFRSNVSRLKHREHLLDLLSQSRIILQKAKDLQQLSHLLLHEVDNDSADRTR